MQCSQWVLATWNCATPLAHRVSFESKEWLQMMDSDLKCKRWNDATIIRLPQTEPRQTWIELREHNAQPRRTRFVKLVRSFFWCLRNQSLIGKPNMRQSKWDSDSTINQRKGKPRSIQLDWPSIAGWAYASIFAVAVWFQIRNQFWISQSKLHICSMFFFFFFQKVEKWARTAKHGVFGDFSVYLIVLR